MKTYYTKHIPIYIEWYRAKKEDKMKMALNRGHEYVSLTDPSAYEKIASHLHEKGWVIERRNFPNSTLSGVKLVSPDKEVAFQVDVMPYDQAVILSAILIYEYENGGIHLPDVPQVV